MVESFKDNAAGDRNTGNGSSSVRDCAELRSSSSEHSLSGESASIKTDVNKNNTILYIQNVTKYLNYIELMNTLSAFGTIERIKTVNCEETNKFYIKFSNALDANKAHLNLNNMKIFNRYLQTKILNHHNVQESNDDFIPDPEYLIERTSKRTSVNKLTPIHNIVIAEEGHSELNVFDFLNKMIGVPKLTPETFKKFGRNSYLVKVANQSQGYMLQGATKNYGDSGILSVKPYDDFNGCKGKIYNSDLAKLPIEKLLDRCP